MIYTSLILMRRNGEFKMEIFSLITIFKGWGYQLKAHYLPVLIMPLQFFMRVHMFLVELMEKENWEIYKSWVLVIRILRISIIIVLLERAEWRQLPYKDIWPSARFGHSYVSYQDSLYLFGGWDGTITLNDFWRYTPSLQA